MFLGTDALTMAQAKVASFKEELEAGKEISGATDF
jgi:hypothetical protein